MVVSYDEIKTKNYSFSAGQYFDIKLEHKNISEAEFKMSLKTYEKDIGNLFEESSLLQEEIKQSLKKLSSE